MQQIKDDPRTGRGWMSELPASRRQVLKKLQSEEREPRPTTEGDAETGAASEQNETHGYEVMRRRQRENGGDAA